MNLSKNASLALIGAGVLLALIALVEHFAVSALIVPHLGIYLVVLGVILGAVGAWGYLRGSRG